MNNKKNVIFLVVDSVFFDKTNSNDYRNCPTPFLNKMKKNAIYTTNMYSEAPYTEAALVSLLGGVDTLKYGGYLKKLWNKKTILDVFKENDYEVFFNGYQPLVYPKYSYPGITKEYYNVCYDFSSAWSYRLEFYSNIYKKDGLSDKYLNMLCEMLEDNLNNWMKFFNDMLNKSENTDLIYNLVNTFGLEDNISLLQKEIDLFNKNKKDYLIELFNKEKEHNLFKIKTYCLDKRQTSDFKINRYNRYIKVFKKIYNKNLKYNLVNNKIVFNDFVKDNNKFIKLLKVYKNCLFDKDLMEKIDYNKNFVKASPSIRTMYNHFFNHLKSNDIKKPFFAYLHTEECHYPEIFYSHDIDDFNVLDKEFKRINDYISNIKKGYKGSLAYDLSLLYTDMCIENLYNNLKENDMLKDTIFVMCADHGSSYTFDPFHESYVKNFYRENYNIPFLVFGDGIEKKELNNFYNSKDIPATILDICNIKKPDSWDGMSILKNSRDYVLLENVNGGCPDYNYRNIFMGIRDNKYSIVMELNVNKKFEDGSIYSIYDVNNDIYERNNLKDSIDKTLINIQLNNLEKEFNVLVKNIKNNDFL